MLVSIIQLIDQPGNIKVRREKTKRKLDIITTKENQT